MDVSRGWITAGSNEVLWGDAGTYKRIPAEALPPITGLDGSLAWLRNEPDAPSAMTFEHAEPAIDERIVEVKRAGLKLPDELVVFVKDRELHERIPSCTACYWDLGARLETIPGHAGGERLLRFMNDQQACYLWYLLLHPDGRHEVAVAWPEWKDDPTGDFLEDAVTPRDLMICASSFEEFIKRWWIENKIWFLAHKGGALEGELHAYAEQARAAVARGLVSGERPD